MTIMTITGVVFNFIGAASLLFAGMAFEDKDAPAYTALILFMFWLCMDVVSMLLLSH